MARAKKPPTPNKLGKYSGDLVFDCRAIKGRCVTLRFSGLGPSIVMSVWRGKRKIGYLDATEVNGLLVNAVSRASCADLSAALRCYLQSAGSRLNDVAPARLTVLPGGRDRG